jgi:hypothetical protein
MNKKGFMLGWLAVNLLGWMIGIYSAFFRMGDILSQLENVTGLWQLPDNIGLIFASISIPLGLGLGIMQCTQLGRWKISAIPWIIVTALAWIIPFLAFSRIRYILLWTDPMGSGFTDYLESLWFLYPIALLIVGADVGLLQVLVMGKSISKPGFWVLANALGLLVFGLLVDGLLRIPMGLWLGGIVYLIKNSGSFLGRPDEQLSVIWLSLPFLATLIMALPMGFILLRYGNSPLNAENESVEKTAA